MDIRRQDTGGIGVSGGRIAPPGEVIHRIGLHFPHRCDDHRPLSDVGGQEAHRGRQRRPDGRRARAVQPPDLVPSILEAIRSQMPPDKAADAGNQDSHRCWLPVSASAASWSR